MTASGLSNHLHQLWRFPGRQRQQVSQGKASAFGDHARRMLVHLRTSNQAPPLNQNFFHPQTAATALLGSSRLLVVPQVSIQRIYEDASVEEEGRRRILDTLHPLVDLTGPTSVRRKEEHSTTLHLKTSRQARGRQRLPERSRSDMHVERASKHGGLAGSRQKRQMCQKRRTRNLHKLRLKPVEAQRSSRSS
jgi:hypothetical protein